MTSIYTKVISKGRPETLIRFSVGCEDEEDLWNDIKYCLDGIL